MKQLSRKKIRRLVGCILGHTPVVYSFIADAASHNVGGNLVSRYDIRQQENKQQQTKLILINHLNYEIDWRNNWKTEFRLRTTIIEQKGIFPLRIDLFNQEKQQPSEMFLQRLNITYDTDNYQFSLGKIPWHIKANTNFFWRPILHPFGISAKLKLSSEHQISTGYYRPPDGEWNTVGELTLIHWRYQFKNHYGRFVISPWLIDYQGDNQSLHAKKDTELDNRFLHLALSYTVEELFMGVDLSQSLASFNQLEAYKDQKQGLIGVIGYGKFNNIGDIQTKLSFYYIERFSALREFVMKRVFQPSAVNFKSIEFETRMLLDKHWSVGTRLGYGRTLVGERIDGKSLAMEMVYTF